jgi:hypothetical protein
MHQRIALRLKKAEKESKTLKELSGALSVRVQTQPRPLITADDVLQAAGKTFRGKDDGSIKVLEVKAGKEETTLRIELQPPQGASPLAPMSAEPGPVGSYNGLALLDAQGNLVPARYQLHIKPVPGGIPITQYEIAYRPDKDLGVPARLVWIGRRSVTVEVPFVLQDLPVS